LNQLATLPPNRKTQQAAAGPTFTPSVYQQAVFHELVNGDRDLLIDAVAGSGKTTTIMQGLTLLPGDVRNDTLLAAFSVQICEALKKKAPLGVTVKTNHGVGRAAIAKRFRQDYNKLVHTQKYRDLIRNFWIGNYRKKTDSPLEEEGELFDLIDMTRLTLTDPRDHKAVLAMAVDRELPLSNPDRMLDALQRILAVGQDLEMKKHHPGFHHLPAPYIIDYADMLWLPYVLDLPLQQYSMVLVDEAQDLNAAQLSLLLRSRKPGGRMVFVGDPRQSIYRFMGADSNSWTNIAEATNAKQLPLSVCYRCPKSIIGLAKEIVPDIEAADNAPEGAVQYITNSDFQELVTNHDMVLCRVNAPLVNAAFRLIGEGKPAKVRGRDIGGQLTRLLKALERTNGFTFDKFLTYTENYREVQDRVLRQKKGNELILSNMHDRVDSLEAIYIGATERGATSIYQVRKWIYNLFMNEENGHVNLSSIHKAKGLEADTVFLLRPDQIPHPMAKTPDALVQEQNLRYVAITRAMKRLYIVQHESSAAKELQPSTQTADMTTALSPDTQPSPAAVLLQRSQELRHASLQLQDRVVGVYQRNLQRDIERAARIKEAIRTQERILQQIRKES
jgi:DNA helicase-2/ATP-dependent DNA helicase PcrA